MLKFSKTIILFLLITILGITSCYAVDLNLTDSDDLTNITTNSSSNTNNTNSTNTTNINSAR